MQTQPPSNSGLTSLHGTLVNCRSCWMTWAGLSHLHQDLKRKWEGGLQLDRPYLFLFQLFFFNQTALGELRKMHCFNIFVGLCRISSWGICHLRPLAQAAVHKSVFFLPSKWKCGLKKHCKTRLMHSVFSKCYNQDKIMANTYYISSNKC